MSKKPPYIKLYVKDFAFDVEGMTKAQIGGAMLELINSYKSEEIPEKYSEFSLFFELKNSIKKYNTMCETNRNNRLKTKTCKNESSTDGQRMVNDRLTTNQNQNQNQNQKDKKHTKNFNEFWELFPKQRIGNKEKAKNSYLKALKEKRATIEEIQNGVEKYAVSDEATKNGGQFAKGCAAWLNDDRWKNDYSRESQPGKNNGHSVDEVYRMSMEDTTF